MASYFIVVYVNAYDFKYNAELGYRSCPSPDEPCRGATWAW